MPRQRSHRSHPARRPGRSPASSLTRRCGSRQSTHQPGWQGVEGRHLHMRAQPPWTPPRRAKRGGGAGLGVGAVLTPRPTPPPPVRRFGRVYDPPGPARAGSHVGPPTAGALSHVPAAGALSRAVYEAFTSLQRGVDKQGGRARRLQHARARQGDHHVHGGLMSDMHFSGMLILSS